MKNDIIAKPVVRTAEEIFVGFTSRGIPVFLERDLDGTYGCAVGQTDWFELTPEEYEYFAAAVR